MNKIFLSLIILSSVLLAGSDDLIINSPTLIIKKGKAETSVQNFLLNNIDPSSIKDLRKQKEKLIKNKNIKIDKELITHNYVKEYKEGEILKLYGLSNRPMVVEIFDKNKNNIKFNYVVSGSEYITIEQDKNQPNRLFITPTQKFRSGTILIGTNIFDFPIQLKIVENTNGNEINNYTKIITSKAKIDKTLSVDERFKKAIFNEEVNLNNFANYPEIDYELWDIKKGTNIFMKDALKIYFVDNSPKKSYYIVLLNKHFKILGYDNLLFQKYSNDYNVYYLDFNTNVFSIISTNNFKSLNNEERIRVVIRN